MCNNKKQKKEMVISYKTLHLADTRYIGYVITNYANDFPKIFTMAIFVECSTYNM